MPLILTTRGELDESLLIKTAGVVDTEDEYTTWVEYCPRDCAGQAHRTGQADAPHCFCLAHIHRSVNLTLKKWPEGMQAIAANLG